MALKPMYKHRIEDIEIELLLIVLKERWGYDFTGYARASLKRRLEQMMEYFDVDCLSRLLPSMLYDSRAAQNAINAISVPTSEFFRDPAVWLFIRNELLPRLHSFPRINIWQIGCGRGQETFTLAILLQEAGLLKKTRLVATDINGEFLVEARQGRWSKRDLAAWQCNYKVAGGTGEFEDYFSIDDKNLVINENLRSRVEFLQHNLVVDDVFLETQWIVCRNVLIYFGEALQQRVFDVIMRSLERGGYLLLGRAESLPENYELSGALKIFEASMRLYHKPVRGRI